jgi:hypothetical protein
VSKVTIILTGGLRLIDWSGSARRRADWGDAELEVSWGRRRSKEITPFLQLAVFTGDKSLRGFARRNGEFLDKATARLL